MFTNRLFNLIVAALIVVVAIQLISVVGSPAARLIDPSTGSKYADRYDRMNDFPAKDLSSIVSQSEARYDRMNHFPATDLSSTVSKYENRYDRMNDFPGMDRSSTASKYESRYDRMNDLP